MQQQITKNWVPVLLATSKIYLYSTPRITIENEVSSSTSQADYRSLKNNISQLENSVAKGFLTWRPTASQQVEVLEYWSQHGCWKGTPSANEKGTPSGIKKTSKLITKICAKMTKTSHHPRLKSKPIKIMSIVIYKEWKLTAEFEHDKQEDYCALLNKGRHHNLKPSGV